MSPTSSNLTTPAVPYAAWARKEIKFNDIIKRNKKGRSVKRVQEWLTFHGFALGIDGDFGPVTEYTVSEFQDYFDMPRTGKVDRHTHGALVAPMLRALTPITTSDTKYEDLVVEYAEQHLNEHPVEIGGQNCGPWVRLYMQGNDGAEWPWCAGFVSFILRQAADTLDMQTPIGYTFSCDIMATNAKQRDRFVRGTQHVDATGISRLHPGVVFLVRRTASDWTHTGLAIHFDDGVFETIEGNTNDEGSREGYEVCRRTRNFAKKDFVLVE